MGKFKHEGSPELALAEECAEVIQVITKKNRFSGDWDELPVSNGNDLTRWQQLEAEMDDVIFQWQRLKEERFQQFKQQHEMDTFDPENYFQAGTI